MLTTRFSARLGTLRCTSPRWRRVAVWGLLAACATWPCCAQGVRWVSASWGGGDIFCDIACHPDDARVVWAVTWQAGLLRSSDGGDSWQPASGNLGALEGVAVVPDPANPRGAYYAAVSGIWHTADDGVRWQRLPGTQGFVFSRTESVRPLAVSAELGTLYAGTAQGTVHVSSDRGRTWTQVPWSNDAPVRVIAEIPGQKGVVITLAERAGLYLLRGNIAAGPRFARRAPAFPVLDVVVESASPFNMYAVCGRHGIWVSERHGEGWNRVIFEGRDNEEDFLFVAQAGRGRERAIYALSAECVFRTMDGRRWERLKDDRQYDVRANPTRQWFHRPSRPTALSGSPSADVLFFADHWSLQRTDNATGNLRWLEIARGAAVQAVYDAVMDAEGNLVIAGDRSGVLASSDGGRSFRALWPRAYDVDVGRYTCVAIGAKGGLVAAAVDKWKGIPCVYWGTGRAFVFEGRAAGIEGDTVILRDSVAPAGPWRVSMSPCRPGNGFIALAGRRPGMFATADGGATWHERALPRGCMPFRALGTDFEREGRVYLGGFGGNLWISPDGAASWDLALPTKEGVVDLAVAPEGFVYALGVAGTVWRSTTYGVTWERPVPAGQGVGRALTVDPSDRRRVYAAVGDSVALSVDGGASWREYTRPPHRLPDITCLCVDPRDGTLFAGTRGAGLWRIEVAGDDT